MILHWPIIRTGPIHEFRGEFLGELERELDLSPWLLPPLSLYLKVTMAFTSS